MALEFDDYERAVVDAIRVIGGVSGREWFRSDMPAYREAFDRLVERRVILPSTEYHLAPDILEGLRADGQTPRSP